MFSLVGWGGDDRLIREDDDDFLESGDGVVSRDEQPDATEADDENDDDRAADEVAPAAVALCLT